MSLSYLSTFHYLLFRNYQRHFHLSSSVSWKHDSFTKKSLMLFWMSTWSCVLPSYLPLICIFIYISTYFQKIIFNWNYLCNSCRNLTQWKLKVDVRFPSIWLFPRNTTSITWSYTHADSQLSLRYDGKQSPLLQISKHRIIEYAEYGRWPIRIIKSNSWFNTRLPENQTMSEIIVHLLLAL